MVDEALRGMHREFAKLYSPVGRPSIAPERLLRAMLLQVFYGIRSERLLVEQLDYNLLFRWFVGLSMDEPVWDATTFSKNRERFVCGGLSCKFMEKVLEQARGEGLLSDEHFSVDGTLIEAWASMKSFKAKGSSEGGSGGSGRNCEVDFNFTTDPDARLYRKGKGHESKLCYMGHVLMENRSGLAVQGEVTRATGKAEREAALEMLSMVETNRRITVGADKGYDTRDFVRQARNLEITAHVAQHTSGRSSAIDRRTTRHKGYSISQRARKRVEEIFGWVKATACMAKTKYRGLRKVDWIFTLALTAYNLIRMRNLGVAAC